MGKKRKKGEQRQGVCVYCGSDGLITVEHVFPKTIFLVLDKEMITVPACGSCNQIKSLGDGDLRNFIIMDVFGGEHPDAPAMLEKLLRKSNVRLRNWLQRQLVEAEDVELVTEGGIIVGNLSRIEFNGDRINVAQEMTVRGLYYHEFGVALPVDCPVDVQHVPWNAAPALVSGLDKAAPAGIRTKGNTTVWWKHNAIEGGEPTDTVWQICYNNGVVFLISTGRAAEMVRVRREAMEAKRNQEGHTSRTRIQQIVVPPGLDGRPIIPRQ